MPTSINTMFFLGNFADMDTNETNTNSENAGLILDTYVQPALVDISVNDGDGDGEIWDDEIGTTPGEDFTYDTGSGPVTQFLDSTIVYNIRVTLGDGSTTDMIATVIQMQNGDVFLTDFANNGSLDNLNVQNIELQSVVSADYVGFFANSSVDNTQVVCFAAGTEIVTQAGLCAVEDITSRTAVLTLDNGYQPCRIVSARHLAHPGPKRAPIRIAAGALGHGVPQEALYLSPQHRVLISSPVAQRMFGTRDVLVPAKDLLEIDGISRAQPFLPVAYHHLAFQNHEIVVAAGLYTESYYSGQEARKALCGAQDVQIDMEPARPFAKGRRARNMIARHLKSCAPMGKPLCPRPELPVDLGIRALACQNAFEPARLV